jgi:xanthine dehydrogenase YagR molybdenum-binding subunit
MDYVDFIDFIGGQNSVQNAPPQSPSNPSNTPLSAIIGSSLPRVDGPLKTTGTARYASDYNFPGMVYAVPVRSTIAKGSITSIDTSAASKMPGVLLILRHDNVTNLHRTSQGGGRNSEQRPPFEDNTVSYWGQYVAAVVAETLQQAQAAADVVVVQYNAGKPNVDANLNDPLPALGQPGGPKIGRDAKRGDSEAVYAAAPIKLDVTYSTPVETHNPMEMHATVAVWDSARQRFTLYESSQGVVNHHSVMAQVLGVPKENLEIISRFIGSGFGGKLFPWPHSAIAAEASRRLNRPVKFTLSRQMMFSNVGHRPRTLQRMRLGADTDGKLVSLQQDYRNHTSPTDEIGENCGETTGYLYGVPNVTISSALVQRNVGTPTPMRGPGAVPGLFALESAMDEMAIQLKQDPIAFRLAHDTLTDPSNGKPFSSRHLRECLQVGSEKFGWASRTPGIGSMKKGDLILGWGVACAAWGAGRGPSAATVSFRKDGTLRVSSATQDIGTGTYTIVAQIVSDKTGIPVSKIDVVLGDSSLPPGPMSGGSTATASVVPSIADATADAIKTLLTAATTAPNSTFKGQEAVFTNGRVHLARQPPASGVAFETILAQANLASADGDGKSGGNPNAKDYSMHSFGAQFVEVEWDPGIARLRVSRVVSVIDGGRILNRITATNQVAGAVVMGVGMGLFEETIYDPRNGHAVNDNFADYIVPTIADTPQIDVHFLDIPDPLMGEYGARGIGEIGLAGIAPAITAAVYHATGVRVRSLPVRIEDLLPEKQIA